MDEQVFRLVFNRRRLLARYAKAAASPSELRLLVQPGPLTPIPPSSQAASSPPHAAVIARLRTRTSPCIRHGHFAIRRHCSMQDAVRRYAWIHGENNISIASAGKCRGRTRRVAAARRTSLPHPRLAFRELPPQENALFGARRRQLAAKRPPIVSDRRSELWPAGPTRTAPSRRWPPRRCRPRSARVLPEDCRIACPQRGQAGSTETW